MALETELGRWLTAYGVTGEADRLRLEHLQEALSVLAELTENDIFLDCVDPVQHLGTVVSQAHPGNNSLYQSSVVGQPVLPTLEPAVFHAVEQGVLVRDLKGVTQEGRVVRQDVLPLFGQDGEPIAVLIREKDVSETLSQARKYQELARDREENRPETYGPPEGQSSQLVVREIHHRVKNNLQLVASLLNIQARQSQDPVLQKIFAEHTKRVLNIAAIHDMLTKTEAFDRIPLRALLGRITRELQTLVPEGKSIRLRVAGDDVTVSSDRATAVALVVNELLLNSLEHGYTERDRGTVTVSVYRGALYATVTVADDGCGFVQEGTEDSLGMTLVRMTVRDKLGGALRIQSAPGRGTVSSFDVRLEEN